MAILGINCATENISLAIINSEHKHYEKFWQGPTLKAENLTSYLDEILSTAKLKLTELKLIGIANGPGAFTGMRLSLITAKTIALGFQIPLVPISTLAAAAYQYRHLNTEQKNIRIILTACRGDVNTALFTKDLARLEPDHAVKPETISGDKDTFILENPVVDALSIAALASQSNKSYDKSEILALVPNYSHEARVNLTSKPELRHLKISKLQK